MKPLKQTVWTEDDGNCLAAAICSILEMDIEQFPEMPPVCPEWQKITTDWLNSIGWHVVFVDYPPEMIKGYHLMIGHIGGDENKYHCVVGFDGKVVHDPSPFRDENSEPIKNPCIGILHKILNTPINPFEQYQSHSYEEGYLQGLKYRYHEDERPKHYKIKYHDSRNPNIQCNL